MGRYTDRAFQELFSNNYKFTTWRRCWIALAEAQHELGLSQVTKAMVAEMRNALDEPIDYDLAARKEKELRHDVLAHVHEFGTHCPTAKAIIHAGATSMYVCDNTELLQMREALRLLRPQIIDTMENLRAFAHEHRGLVTLGYTHYQAGQPTTIGKRATLYLHDLMIGLRLLDQAEGEIQARGAKGTTGTQASYFELFDGDFEKVKELDSLVSKKLGFETAFPVTGQTYPRMLDHIIVSALGGIAIAAHKFAVDLRLMSNLKLMDEPFAKGQKGSSAMAYKKNPMRSERMTGLCRKLLGLQAEVAQTAANQWLERTLDDSAIRRMYLPQAFLLTNAILKLYQNITNGMVVYPAQIRRHLEMELPFMATEAIIMEAVKQGGDRQEVHGRVKEHSDTAGKRVKLKGLDNDLLGRIAGDKMIPVSQTFLDGILNEPERFAGPAALQTEEFLTKHVAPVLEQYADLIGTADATINV